MDVLNNSECIFISIDGFEFPIKPEEVDELILKLQSAKENIKKDKE